jgi:hypothetical protein
MLATSRDRDEGDSRRDGYNYRQGSHGALPARLCRFGSRLARSNRGGARCPVDQASRSCASCEPAKGRLRQAGPRDKRALDVVKKFFLGRGTEHGLLGYHHEGRGRNDPPSPHCSCLTRKLDPASWRGFSFRARASSPGIMVIHYHRGAFKRREQEFLQQVGRAWQATMLIISARWRCSCSRS